MSNQALDDLEIRQRQLEKHLLRSPEYLHKADQDLKRQVAMLYLAIALLFIFQGIFVIREARNMPTGLLALIVFTAGLAIVNCVLLIRTKQYLRRLNEGWLEPETKRILETLRQEQDKLRKPEEKKAGAQSP